MPPNTQRSLQVWSRFSGWFRRTIADYSNVAITQMKQAPARLRAWASQTSARIRFKTLALKLKSHRLWEIGNRHGAVPIAAAIAAFVYFGLSFWFQDWFAPIVTRLIKEDALRTLALTLGAAVFGITAIFGSVVLAATQINIERLPHSLFKSVSRRRSLILVSVVSVFVAALLMALSVIELDHYEYVATVMLVAALIATGGLFRRALVSLDSLIDPFQQAKEAAEIGRKTLQMWSGWASLFERTKLSSLPRTSERSSNTKGIFLVARFTFFTHQKSWIWRPVQCIRYLSHLARVYAAKGDHEVVRAALVEIITLCASYIHARQSTFVQSSAFVEVPGSGDEFFTQCYEELRMLFLEAATRPDEKCMVLVVECLAQISILQCSIEYDSTYEPSKTHAHVSTGYLTSLVKDAAAAKRVDVLIALARSLGAVGEAYVKCDDWVGAAAVLRGLSQIAAPGLIAPDWMPASLEAMNQLSEIIFATLIRRGRSFRSLYNEAFSIVQTLLRIYLTQCKANAVDAITGGGAFGRFFLVTSPNGLVPRVLQLADELHRQHKGDSRFEHVATNICELFEDGRQFYREAIPAALSARSMIAQSLLVHVDEIVKALMLVGDASASKYLREKLEGELEKWTWLFLQIPEGKPAAEWANTWRVDEHLYELGGIAAALEYPGLVEEIVSVLLSLAAINAKAGLHLSAVADPIQAAFLLSARSDSWIDNSKITTLIAQHLVPEVANLEKEYVVNVLEHLDEKSQTVDRYSLSKIERGILTADGKKYQALLTKLREQLNGDRGTSSPEGST